VIEVVLRRPRGVIGMRVIEPEQFAPERARLLLGQPVVGRPNEKAPPRPFLGRVRKRHGRDRTVGVADERTAALVRKGLLAVPPNGPGDLVE